MASNVFDDLVLKKVDEAQTFTEGEKKAIQKADETQAKRKDFYDRYYALSPRKKEQFEYALDDWNVDPGLGGQIENAWNLYMGGFQWPWNKNYEFGEQGGYAIGAGGIEARSLLDLYYELGLDHQGGM